MLILSPVSVHGDPEKAKPIECDQVLESVDAHRQQLIQSLKLEKEYSDMLQTQRNQLIKDQPSTEARLPFYVWVIVGIAGGVVLTRGIR